jgi:putative tryptophan/tyrosine transport system ATP-binding protein
MLELNHIHKLYNPGTVNEICLFDDFNLKIDDGQFVSVVGSNGSGKTSMLNIICFKNQRNYFTSILSNVSAASLI